MLISELQKRLDELREIVGDAVIEIRNSGGDFYPADWIEVKDYQDKDGKTKWRVFIDT